jgi:hypothetical protein
MPHIEFEVRNPNGYSFFLPRTRNFLLGIAYRQSSSFVVKILQIHERELSELKVSLKSSRDKSESSNPDF